jgi:toxin-antitoxin system PIN domain toxin
VILPDVNLFLYAVDRRSPRHRPARAFVEATMSGPETVGLAWPVLIAFLRLSTHPAVFEQPLTQAQAFDLVDSWLGLSTTIALHPGERHHHLMRELLEPFGTAGNLVPDAHLAALAREHGARLASSDRDFGRFAGLRWFDPFDE